MSTKDTTTNKVSKKFLSQTGCLVVSKSSRTIGNGIRIDEFENYELYPKSGIKGAWRRSFITKISSENDPGMKLTYRKDDYRIFSTNEIAAIAGGMINEID